MDPLEPYYQIVSKIKIVGVMLFSAYCYVIWVKPFMPGQRKTGRIGAAYAVTMLVLDWMPFYISNVLAYGLGAFAAFLVMCLTDRKNFGQKVFLAVTFFCMRWQSWEIAGDITNWLYKKLTDFVFLTEDHESLSFLYALATEKVEFWFCIYIMDCTIHFALGSALTYVLVRIMLRTYCGGQAHMKGKELMLLLMPSVLGVFAYGVVQFYNRVYERESSRSIFDLPGYGVLMVLYSVVSYATIVVIVYVFQKWKQEQEAEEQRKVFMTQMKDMQSHIAEVERLYSDMRRLRHDMGNHFMTLEQLYVREEYEAAGRYTETLKARMQDISSDVKSGNPVTDAILSGRKKEMEERGISFACDFHYPQKGKADAFDLSIILNNALDNAIDAAVQEERREVMLSSRRVKNMYIVEVANIFTGELCVDGHSGLPFTTKAEEGHGFGLVSIRHVARKYYGDIEIGEEEYEGKRCCVLRVMLQIAE